MINNEFYLGEVQGIMQEVMNSGGEFRFYPKGKSMLPLIRQGKDSIALVAVQGQLKKYDLPLYVRNNGQFVLHRVIGEDSNGYIMCGDNQTTLEYGILPQQIRAKVCAVYRKDRRVEITDKSYILYCKLWCFMPLRRVIIMIKRVFKKIFVR